VKKNLKQVFKCYSDTVQVSIFILEYEADYIFDFIARGLGQMTIINKFVKTGVRW